MSHDDCRHNYHQGNCPYCNAVGPTGDFPHRRLNPDDEGAEPGRAMTPHARSQDDKVNLDDLHQIAQAIDEAEQALEAAMVGQGPPQRQHFVFSVGFALGRLKRVQERIDPAREVDNAP